MEMSRAPDIRRRPHRVTWHPAASDLGKDQKFSRGALVVMVKIFQIFEIKDFFKLTSTCTNTIRHNQPLL
jgi:hypothetical protein